MHTQMRRDLAEPIAMLVVCLNHSSIVSLLRFFPASARPLSLARAISFSSRFRGECLSMNASLPG